MSTDDRRNPPTSAILETFQEHEVDELVRYELLEKRLAKIELAMDELLDLWKGAKGVLSFLKMAAAVGSALAAIAIWAKDHVKL